MNKSELKEKLDLLGTNRNVYSLDGELKSDNIVMTKNYHKWEVFYFDERGKRNNERCFESESEACSYIYDLFKDLKETEVKFRIRT